MKNWGVSLEEVATYYLEAAKQRESEYVLRTKKFDDIIINGNNLERKLKDIISCWISSKIK